MTQMTLAVLSLHKGIVAASFCRDQPMQAFPSSGAAALVARAVDRAEGCQPAFSSRQTTSDNEEQAWVRQTWQDRQQGGPARVGRAGS